MNNFFDYRPESINRLIGILMSTFSIIRKWISWGIRAIAILLLIGTGALWWNQRKLLYLPHFPPGSNKHVSNPKETLGLDYQLVQLKSIDGTILYCFWIPFPSQQSTNPLPSVIYFHGNAGNIGHRMELVKQLVGTFPCNVFLLSYRGYGLSKGIPSEGGIKMDAQAAFCHVKDELAPPNSSIILYGQSLGGAVAAYLANEFGSQIDMVILENTFRSIPKLIPHINPLLTPFIWLCSEYWNTEEELKDMLRKYREKHPFILFLSGLEDEIVPSNEMRELYELVYKRSGGCQLKLFKYGDHNSTWINSDYMETIKHVFREKVALK